MKFVVDVLNKMIADNEVTETEAEEIAEEIFKDILEEN
jgi:hypothetical protein